ncbi:MAG: hypothetical protein HQK79_19360 [Desulfobacterales bacterium]|nr:hypothetical protein [Desulfobacterales bacterium]
MPFITGLGWITGKIPELKNKNYARFSRMDQYSKLGFSAIGLALKDAGLELWKEKRNIGIIASTCYGCLLNDSLYFDTVIPNEGLFPSPNLFAYTLPNCFLGEAAIFWGLIGPTFIISESSQDSLNSIKIAINYIKWENSPVMICGLCEFIDDSKIDIHNKNISSSGLFFVIEKDIRKDCSMYGEIVFDYKNELYFENKKINSLVNLAKTCMSKN